MKMHEREKSIRLGKFEATSYTQSGRKMDPYEINSRLQGIQFLVLAGRIETARKAIRELRAVVRSHMVCDYCRTYRW